MRGRKLSFPDIFHNCTVEIYPREGTETDGRVQSVRSNTTVEIYPREGTETLHLVERGLDLRVEIYPREGTETLLTPGHTFRRLC